MNPLPETQAVTMCGTARSAPRSKRAGRIVATVGRSCAQMCAARCGQNQQSRDGLGDKPRNAETALEHYRAAADKGDALGLHNLGAAYNSGVLGLLRDGSEAARLITRALEAKYEVTAQSLTSHPKLWSAGFWQNPQRRLEEKGLYSGPVDGHPSPATFDVVKRLGSRT